MSTDRYTSPFCERYASKEMQYIFSPDKKFKTWRKLWIGKKQRRYEQQKDAKIILMTMKEPLHTETYR